MLVESVRYFFLSFFLSFLVLGSLGGLWSRCSTHFFHGYIFTNPCGLSNHSQLMYLPTMGLASRRPGAGGGGGPTPGIPRVVPFFILWGRVEKRDRGHSYPACLCLEVLTNNHSDAR